MFSGDVFFQSRQLGKWDFLRGSIWGDALSWEEFSRLRKGCWVEEVNGPAEGFTREIRGGGINTNLVRKG